MNRWTKASLALAIASVSLAAGYIVGALLALYFA